MPTPVPKTYSSDEDVREKFAHITITDDLVVGNFRDAAFSYINMRIRNLYVVPVSGSLNTMSFLKHMEADFAAGKILASVGTLQSSSEVSEYGKMLMISGQKALDLISSHDGKNPAITLEGAAVDTDKSDNAADFPLLGLDSPDDFATYNRPMSGVENDAILAKTNSEKFNSLEDVLTP